MAAALETLRQDIVAHAHDDIVQRWQKLLKRAAALKHSAISLSSEVHANHAWFAEAFCSSNVLYLSSWEHLLGNRFFEGWKLLEQVEIACATMHRNRVIALDGLDYDAMAAQVAEWQKTFPYKVFISPEMVAGWKECSVCRRATDPWSGCTHRKGRVYMGVQCVHIVHDVQFVGMSLVLDPVQKYSVAFPDKVDTFNYDVVRFVRDRVTSPRSRWTCRKELARHPHELFAQHSASSECPCGSGATYGACCLNASGVIRPHMQFTFSEPPPAGLPEVLLPDRDGAMHPAVLRP